MQYIHASRHESVGKRTALEDGTQENMPAHVKNTCTHAVAVVIYFTKHAIYAHAKSTEIAAQGLEFKAHAGLRCIEIVKMASVAVSRSMQSAAGRMENGPTFWSACESEKVVK